MFQSTATLSNINRIAFCTVYFINAKCNISVSVALMQDMVNLHNQLLPLIYDYCSITLYYYYHLWVIVLFLLLLLLTYSSETWPTNKSILNKFCRAHLICNLTTTCTLCRLYSIVAVLYCYMLLIVTTERNLLQSTKRR